MKYKPSYWMLKEAWAYEAREHAAEEAAQKAIPAGLRKAIAPIYNEARERTGSIIEANRTVMDRLPGRYLAMSDQAICDLAEKVANHCLSEYAAGYCQTADELIDAARHFIPQILRNEPLTFPAYASDQGKIDRTFDHMFWRRKLRTTIRQAREVVHLSLNSIGHHGQKYCSDDAVAERAEQLSRLDFFLNSHYILDRPTGEIFSMGSCANHYEQTEARMLNRINGLEKYSKGQGLLALFVTLTLPPKYHPAPTTESSWEGLTPKDGQTELARRWKRIQWRLNKAGIRWGFFRVVEPHQDGCPHWHLCIWADPSDHWKIMAEIYPEFQDARQEDKKGRVNYWQVTVSIEDPTQGNSAAYMRKYLTKHTSKKLDESREEADRKGAPEWSHARVDAWRATWKINAFRFGGSIIPTGAIGQFDELRRFLPKEKNAPRTKPKGLPQDIWDAVDEGDFCAFLVTLKEEKRMKYARESRENTYKEETSRTRGILLDDLVSLLSREAERFEIIDDFYPSLKKGQESKGPEKTEGQGPKDGHFGIQAPKIPIGHPLDDWLTDLY